MKKLLFICCSIKNNFKGFIYFKFNKKINILEFNETYNRLLKRDNNHELSHLYKYMDILDELNFEKNNLQKIISVFIAIKQLKHYEILLLTQYLIDWILLYGITADVIFLQFAKYFISYSMVIYKYNTNE